MTGIVIAAGRGVRMLPYTSEMPKCMLPINGQPLLSYAVGRLREAGCSRVVVITGHLAERIVAPDCVLVHNPGYESNNILHSLMHARDWFYDDLIVSYSDILVEPDVYRRLAASTGDIVIAVDVDWRAYYVGRSDHPVSEAENCVIRRLDAYHGLLETIGKHISDAPPADRLCGEFIGLWKMSRRGVATFCERFDALDSALDAAAPFQAASEWRKAYITDFFASLLELSVDIHGLLIERGWAELDVVQDYERLPAMFEQQHLFSLLEHKGAQR